MTLQLKFSNELCQSFFQSIVAKFNKSKSASRRIT